MNCNPKPYVLCSSIALLFTAICGCKNVPNKTLPPAFVPLAKSKSEKAMEGLYYVAGLAKNRKFDGAILEIADANLVIISGSRSWPLGVAGSKVEVIGSYYATKEYMVPAAPPGSQGFPKDTIIPSRHAIKPVAWRVMGDNDWQGQVGNMASLKYQPAGSK